MWCDEGVLRSCGANLCCAHKGIVCFHEKRLHLFVKGGCVVVSRGVVYGEKRLDANKVGVPI